MQILTYAAIVAFALASVYMIISLPLAINRNMRRGGTFREALIARIESLPLGRMLAVRGVDANHYVAGNRVVEIEDHMKTCGACDAGTRCSTDLDRGELTDDAAYCPNRDRIAAFEAEREAA